MKVKIDNRIFYIDKNLISRDLFIQKVIECQEPIDRYLHRKDGPAYIAANDLEIWFHHGKKHRTNGPAATHKSYAWYWFINDIEYLSLEEYLNSGYFTEEEKVALKLEYSHNLD